ncbi:unnamed protein product [Citrullus colocynthis]|uniref:Leucine-rich repeat-containing N-terminal plant-type domain-containing protein n=1 Tax=Citrullus colocynthis TaxID=252529 RepID=A0ABP0XQF3_9ROSI
MIVVGDLQVSNGCAEEQRLSLLHIKTLFLSYNSPQFSNYNNFPSWTGTNCCDWDRVKCDSSGTHVVDLLLYNSFWGQIYPFNQNYHYWFNLSLFQNFKELKILDLAYNGFTDFSENQGLENLRELHLRGNALNHMLELQGLENLRELDLSFNGLNTLQLQGLDGFSSLKTLETLNLENNYLNNSIFASLRGLISLKILNLYGNKDLGGIIPTQEFCERNNLVELNLRNNQIRGEFPECVGNLTRLKHVDTSCNQFCGKFPTTISKLTSLEYLSLHENDFEGAFSLSSLALNNSKLEHLDLSNNSLTGPLQLSTWNHSLKRFEISSNLFGGQLPTHLGLLIPKVEHFNISRNSFEGNLPPSMKQMKSLSWLDVSNNKFSGNLQMSLFNIMPSLEFLLLANNNFSGSIEDERIDNTLLVALDISNNTISGKIPSWIGSLTLLQYVQMSRNRFAGMIPTAPHFTYPESSFYGNPYLCGSYIEHKCSRSPVLPTDNKSAKWEEEEDGAFIDLEAFYWSFAASYIVILLGFVVVLYTNPQWRQRWFYFFEDC